MTKTKPTRPSFRIVFRAEADMPAGPRPIERVRQLLKIAKRSLGLICTSCAEDLPAELPAPVPDLDSPRTEPNRRSQSSRSRPMSKRHRDNGPDATGKPGRQDAREDQATTERTLTAGEPQWHEASNR